MQPSAFLSPMLSGNAVFSPHLAAATGLRAEAAALQGSLDRRCVPEADRLCSSQTECAASTRRSINHNTYDVHGKTAILPPHTAGGLVLETQHRLRTEYSKKALSQRREPSTVGRPSRASPRVVLLNMHRACPVYGVWTPSRRTLCNGHHLTGTRPEAEGRRESRCGPDSRTPTDRQTETDPLEGQEHRKEQNRGERKKSHIVYKNGEQATSVLV